jgi:hypothetical protein
MVTQAEFRDQRCVIAMAMAWKSVAPKKLGDTAAYQSFALKRDDR